MEVEQHFLGEGHDIVTRETCVNDSLNKNNLGKAVFLHFSLLGLGLCQSQSPETS
jgi:hypothetical protein